MPTTPASFMKHPFHPMLVPLPIGLWIFSLICDVVYQMGWGAELWNNMAFWTMVGGVAGALLAAVPGYLDYRSIQLPDVKQLGKWHLILNLSIVALYVVNLRLRLGPSSETAVPVLLSVVGVSLLGVSGWLGGEMVYVHGIAVDDSRKQ